MKRKPKLSLKNFKATNGDTYNHLLNEYDLNSQRFAVVRDKMFEIKTKFEKASADYERWWRRVQNVRCRINALREQFEVAKRN